MRRQFEEQVTGCAPAAPITPAQLSEQGNSADFVAHAHLKVQVRSFLCCFGGLALPFCVYAVSSCTCCLLTGLAQSSLPCHLGHAAAGLDHKVANDQASREPIQASNGKRAGLRAEKHSITNADCCMSKQVIVEAD